ncbi:MAG: O-antigen ligase family protein [Verrucomicrobia bacterium]|nr:O-antigen ligase family protein [Verrucomicrobiota bacterium]
MRRVADIAGKAIWVAVGLYAFFLPWGVTGAHVALGIGVLAWLGRTIAERRGRWVGWPVGSPLLLFLTLFGVACIVGWVPKESLRELVALRTLLVIFLVAANLRDVEGLRRLALVLVATLALFSLYAVAARFAMVAGQRAIHVPLVVSPQTIERLEREGRREGENFWLPDLGSMSEAGQLAMGLPIALALLLACRDKRLRTGLLIALVLIGANLIMNMKRGAWAGCFGALIVLAAVERRRRVLAVLIALVVLMLAVPASRARLVAAMTGEDGERLQLWASVPKAVARWPLGVGPGCSYHVIRTKQIVPRDVYLAMPDKVHFHNTIAELAVTAGPMTVAAFLWWFGAFGVWAVRRLRRMERDAPARPIVLAGLVAATAFFVNGLFEFNLGDSDVTMMVYLGMGLVMAAVRTRSSSGAVGGGLDSEPMDAREGEAPEPAQRAASCSHGR